MAAFRIPPSSYPYTNGTGITVNATTVGVTLLGDVGYTCASNMFNGSSTSWWINSATASITFNFSAPVSDLTILVNGTNTTEEFYFNSNGGPVNLTNYCTTNFTLLPPGNTLQCSGALVTGTIITANNPAGATQYVLTHNGVAGGSRVTLLDCYVGSTPPSNFINCSIPSLSFCAGNSTTINYTPTGTFNAGNVFSAELSNATGSFAAPVVIGTLVSTVAGSIPCTIPLGTPSGTGYRVRVNSSNPPVFGINNGTNINIHALPTVTANPTPSSVCNGGSLVLNGLGANTYSWSSGITNGIAFTPSSSATYTVTGTDAFGCSNTGTVMVPVNAIPTVTASVFPSNTVCNGTSCILNGSGASTYVWNSPVINNTAFTPSSTATYTVTGTDVNNCSNTASIQIVVNPLPIISVNASPNDSICYGNNVTLTASGGVNYVWSGGVQNGVPFSPAGSLMYTVTGTDANNCVSSATQSIVVKPLPVVNLGKDTSICIGNSVLLNAYNPNATYLWQNGNTTPSITVSQTGFYYVLVSIDGCNASDTIHVTMNTLPPLDLGIDTAICEGETITLDASCPGCTYVWQDNSTNPTYTVTQEANYSVTVTRLGCSSSDQIYVDQIPLPIVNLGNDTVICPGESVTLLAFKPNASYVWQDQSTKPNFIANQVGNYWVEVTVGQCTGRDELYVGPSTKCECPLFVPNAFSPNNDGKNDEFKLMGANHVILTKFSIYNRWGQEVFSTQSTEDSWNGNFKGAEAEMGTYFYLVQYQCNYNGKDITLTGDVILIR